MFNKRKKSKKDRSQDELVRSEVLNKGLQELLEGRIIYFTDEELGNKEATDKWNEFAKQLSEERRYHINYANTLLREITGMDSVKAMVSNVDKQNDSLQTMVASSEELSASIEDVASISEIGRAHV